MSPAQSPLEAAVRLLRELGLTPTEAEVYCAALQTAAVEPVSSYKLAQTMGRDPANVGKVLAALVRHHAMTVVQDKPRLYHPTDPTTFTARVREQLERNTREAEQALLALGGPTDGPDAIGLALADADAVYGRARDLLSRCRRSALVFGAKECLREIGGDLEAAAEQDGCLVQVLSPVAMVAEFAEIAVFSPVSALGQLPEREFLHLVVDGRAWLAADLTDPETDTGPCGWWSDNSPVAAVLAGSLALAWQTGHSSHIPRDEPDVAMDEAVDIAAEQQVESLPDETPAPVTPESATEAPPAPPEPTPDDDEEDDGLTFLVRHDRRAQEKGEP